ncbi:MAG: NUDIX domain-containing protein [Nanoarchaeota archaeon]
MKEYLYAVDDEDNVIEKIEGDIILEKKMLHRNASVIIVNKEGKLYVHQRKKTKNLYPGMWDVKAGGGVRFGETYEEAALREMSEEVGINNQKIKFLFSDKFRSNEFNCNRKVYTVIWDGSITIQKEEIEQGRFMDIIEIENMVDKLSPTEMQIINKYPEIIKNAKTN